MVLFNNKIKRKRFDKSFILLLSGLLIIIFAVVLTVIGGVSRQKYISIIGIALIILGAIFYYYSNEARIKLENKLELVFNLRFRIVLFLICEAMAVLVFFLFMPIRAALIFSGIVVFNGVLGLLIGLYLYKRRNKES